MKSLVVITAFLLLLKPIFPLVEYAMNFDYIANVLCENKAKPEMHCNGKCHLMKQLANASEAEKPASEHQKKSVSTFELFCDTALPIELPQRFLVAAADAVFAYHNSFCASFEAKIFHPPSSAVVL